MHDLYQALLIMFIIGMAFHLPIGAAQVEILGISVALKNITRICLEIVKSRREA